MKTPLSRCACSFAVVLGIVVLCGFAKLSDIETAIIQKDYKTARDLAREFLKKNQSAQQVDQVRYYLGVSELGLLNYRDARSAFQQIMASRPSEYAYDRAWLGVIDSYGMEEKFAEALAQTQKFLKERPDSEFLSVIYLKLGRGNLKLRNWDTADKYLRALIEKFPASFEAHTARQLLEEKRYFTIQVGSFLEQPRAIALAEELKNRGEYAYIVETQDAEGRTFYRVRVGQFSSIEAARKARADLSGQGYPTHIYP